MVTEPQDTSNTLKQQIEFMDIKDNKQLQDSVAGFINQITATTKDMADFTGNALHKGVDMASQQIPDIIHQYVLWGICENVFFAIVGVGIFLAPFTITKRVSKEWEKDWLNRNDAITAFGSIGITAGFLLGAGMFILSIREVLEITISPKVWLIEQASHLLR